MLWTMAAICSHGRWMPFVSLVQRQLTMFATTRSPTAWALGGDWCNVMPPAWWSGVFWESTSTILYIYIYIYIGSIHFLRRCTIHRSEINDMLQCCSNVLWVRGVLGDSPGLNYSEAPEDFRQPWDHRTQHDGFWSGEDGRNMKKLVTSRTM